MATKYRNPRPDVKNSELANIHIAKQQLGLDDDTYRAMLQQVAGVNSSKDLTPAGRVKVLEHLKTVGFVPKTANAFKGRPKTTDSNPQLKKIEALLADAGQPWSYALAIAKRMYKKDRLEFCSSGELTGVITALIK
ncbi:MAG: regulatory protein GemA [Methylovulum sp.]|nr:regulatory protein GemA [Methylovulum sp.]